MQSELLSHLVRVKLYCPAVKDSLLLIIEKPKLKVLYNTGSGAAFQTLVRITSYLYHNTISSCVFFFFPQHFHSLLFIKTEGN